MDYSHDVEVRILRPEILGPGSRVGGEHVEYGLTQLREVPAQRREGENRSYADFDSIAADLAHRAREDVRGVLAPGDRRLDGAGSGLTVQHRRSPPCKPETDRRCPYDREIAQDFADGDIRIDPGQVKVDVRLAWAKALNHRAAGLLTNELMWKPVVSHAQESRPGIRAREYFKAVQRVREDLPGLELLDGDARRDIPDTDITGAGLRRLRWRRYEIESYLIHPDALANFVQVMVGVDYAPHVEDMLDYMQRKFPPDVFNDPLGEHEFLYVTKARTRLIPPLLEAAGIYDLPYTRYDEIAALMLPEEIHPEAVEKLDAICRAFGVEP